LVKLFVSKLDSYGDGVTDQSTFTITTREFADYWDIRLDKARESLEAASNTLFSRKVSALYPNSGFKHCRWCSMVEYNPDLDTFTICWTREVLKHLTLQREYFTKLDLGELTEFTSSYSFRLYELLSAISGGNSYKNPRLEVEAWMNTLDVPTSLYEYKKFKAMVLKPCIAELREKTQRFRYLDFKEHKVGTKVMEIEFTGVGIGARYKEVAKGC